ncbi:hypothetical protein HMPREF2111_01357, partial [Staphylococcus aureus 917]
QNQKIGQMKSKKLFLSVRFIIEPIYITFGKSLQTFKHHISTNVKGTPRL